jgi:hypothetical protein
MQQDAGESLTHANVLLRWGPPATAIRPRRISCYTPSSAGAARAVV